MKRLITIAISVCIILSMFTSCQTKKEVEQTNEELNLYLFIDMTKGIHDKAVEFYKQKYPNIKVNLESVVPDKAPQEAYYQYQLDLATRMMSGKSPDVIFMDMKFLYNVDVNKHIKNNVYAPLDEIIKADNEFKESDYNMKVINGCRYNDSLYFMPLSYYIPFITSPQQTLDDYKTQITSNDILSVFNSFKGYLDEISKKKSETMLIYDEFIKPTNESVVPSLYNFMSYSGFIPLDYSNKKNNFTGENEEKNKELIESYKLLYNEFMKKRGSEENINLATKNKEILFETFANQAISLIRLTGNVSRVYGYSEAKTFTLNTMDNRVSANVKNLVAISNDSKNKQNAYNFIKILLSDELQSSVDAISISSNIPINTKHFIKNAKVFSGYGAIDKLVPTSKIPEEWYEQIANTVEQVENVIIPTPWDVKFYELIEPYFKGEKTYDECMDLIKRQAQIYVSE